MVKAILNDEVIAEGNSIDEVINNLNYGEKEGNEWFYVYREGVIDGYFGSSEEIALADKDGELADVILDVY